MLRESRAVDSVNPGGMKRRLFNLIVVLSLIQCVGVGQILSRPGVRAYTLCDTRDSRWSFVSAPLVVWVEQRTVIAAWSAPYTRIKDQRLWGFGHGEYRYDSNLWHDGTYRPVRLRTWFAPSFVVLLGSWVGFGWCLIRIGRGLRKAWRRSEGRCKECGYDLRATPGRCPECGEPAPAPNSVAS